MGRTIRVERMNAGTDDREREIAFQKLTLEYAQMREEERHGITSFISLLALAVAVLGAISYALSSSCDLLGRFDDCINIAGWVYGMIPLPLMAIVGFLLMLFNLAILRAPYLQLIERGLQRYPGRLEHGPISLPFPIYQHLNRPIFGGRRSYQLIWNVVWLVVGLTLIGLSATSVWLWSMQRHAVWWHIALAVLGHLLAFAVDFTAWLRLFSSKKLLGEAMRGLSVRLDEILISEEMVGEADFTRWGWEKGKHP